MPKIRVRGYTKKVKGKRIRVKGYMKHKGRKRRR